MKKQKNNEKLILKIFDWAKFIALFCIVLPICFMIFQGYKLEFIIIICIGVFIFVCNLIFGYFYDKKIQENQQKSDKESKTNSKQKNKLN